MAFDVRLTLKLDGYQFNALMNKLGDIEAAIKAASPGEAEDVAALVEDLHESTERLDSVTKLNQPK